MELNDKTILRIKVPAHLYESVKAQLTLKEGKNDYGMPEGTVIKEKKTSEGTKKAKTKSASERRGSNKTSARKKDPNAPQRKTGAMYDDETSRLGAGVSETKKMGLEEFKALAELLHAEIAKLEEKEGKDEETPKTPEEKLKNATKSAEQKPGQGGSSDELALKSIGLEEKQGEE